MTTTHPLAPPDFARACEIVGDDVPFPRPRLPSPLSLPRS